PEEWKAPAPEESAVERVETELEALASGEEDPRILLVTGPGESPKAILESAMQRLDYGPILFSGAGLASSPLAPFFGLPPPPASDSSAPALAARLVASCLCRRRHTPALLQSYALQVRSALASLAAVKPEKPAWVMYERLDAFSAESLDVLSALFDGTEARNLPLFVATGSVVPKGLKPGLLRVVQVPPVPARAIAEAARLGALALGIPDLAPVLEAAARGEGFRLVLALRVAGAGGGAGPALLGDPELDTARLLDAALRTFPAEFGGWLKALALAEDLFDDKAFDGFLDAAGYRSGIRPLIASSLSALGIVLGGIRPRITRPELAEWLALTAGSHDDIDRAFAAELRHLYSTKTIVPSLAFHRRLVEANPDERGRAAIFLDALAADMTGGPSIDWDQVLTPGPAFARCMPLFQSWTENSGELAAEAMAGFAMDAAREPTGSLAQAILSLARSVDDHSRAVKRLDPSQIRSAIIRLHELGAIRAEAKAHRLLGLSSLSAGQINEGSDYLLNAQEIAAAIPDELESFFSSLAAAGATFTLGDFKRSALRLETAAETARSAFRPDWALGSSFAAARLDFELGRYGKSEESFEDIAEKAGSLGIEQARTRGIVWAGRAAAWSGMGNRARARLSGLLADSEAAWFLSELAAWEGDWIEAARLADLALDRIPRRAWRPIDALSWTSGFDLLEGPCLGPWPGSSYLEDQVNAFSAFVHAMAESDPARIVELATRSREERIAAHHPKAHLYDWFAFIACETMENPPFDPETLLSRAWKALQTRTLRMEESTLKNQFLEGNRWNREIVAAARSRRLI
ncbi:MAG TPA: hypothetical protein VMV44_00110, partial [Rectinemataceae bacterium]|nr:hypothetical protein [Rectinemataceae bacterium]